MSLFFGKKPVNEDAEREKRMEIQHESIENWDIAHKAYDDMYKIQEMVSKHADEKMKQEVAEDYFMRHIVDIPYEARDKKMKRLFWHLYNEMKYNIDAFSKLETRFEAASQIWESAFVDQNTVDTSKKRDGYKEWVQPKDLNLDPAYPWTYIYLPNTSFQSIVRQNAHNYLKGYQQPGNNDVYLKIGLFYAWCYNLSYRIQVLENIGTSFSKGYLDLCDVLADREVPDTLHFLFKDVREDVVNLDISEIYGDKRYRKLSRVNLWSEVHHVGFLGRLKKRCVIVGSFEDMMAQLRADAVYFLNEAKPYIKWPFEVKDGEDVTFERFFSEVCRDNVPYEALL